MTNREDAVSEAIGGVLLIALVVIGAAIVGTYVMSQPLPEKIPKVQFSVKQSGNTVYLVHEGGEPVDSGTARVNVIDGVKYEKTFTNWRFGESLSVPVTGADPNSRISVALVYTGNSGDTLLRSVNSPDGFDYNFPVYDPAEIVDLPPRWPTYGPYSGPLPPYNWPIGGFVPQPTIPPLIGSSMSTWRLRIQR
jgi:FlaG/FlaF family flagellin (archaellin)